MGFSRKVGGRIFTSMFAPRMDYSWGYIKVCTHNELSRDARNLLTRNRIFQPFLACLIGRMRTVSGYRVLSSKSRSMGEGGSSTTTRRALASDCASHTRNLHEMIRHFDWRCWKAPWVVFRKMLSFIRRHCFSNEQVRQHRGFYQADHLRTL